MLFTSMCNSPTWNRYKPLHESVIGDAVTFISRNKYINSPIHMQVYDINYSHVRQNIATSIYALMETSQL